MALLVRATTAPATKPQKASNDDYAEEDYDSKILQHPFSIGAALILTQMVAA
jgi:hypothetical protein